MANRLLVGIVRRGGGKLLDLAAGRLTGKAATTVDAAKPKSSLTGAMAGAAIARIATRSVPGAIVVGGGMLAKALYDRRRARQEAVQEAEPGKASDDAE